MCKKTTEFFLMHVLYWASLQFKVLCKNRIPLNVFLILSNTQRNTQTELAVKQNGLRAGTMCVKLPETVQLLKSLL